MIEKHWFVFYTKSRHEKKVKELLLRSGFEVFLPMHKVMRQWSDRKKRVEVPLFNSYIFVRTFEHEIVRVLQIPGVSANIRHNGKPAILRLAEYDLIQRFISSGLFLETSPLLPQIENGDRVKVLDGPLAGVYGIMSGTANDQKLSIILEGLNQVVQVEISVHLIKRA